MTKVKSLADLKKLKDGGFIESYYRSNHKIFRIREDVAPVARKITEAVHSSRV